MGERGVLRRIAAAADPLAADLDGAVRGCRSAQARWAVSDASTSALALDRAGDAVPPVEE